MRQCKWFVCGLATVLFVCSPMWAQDEGKKEGEKKDRPQRTRGEGQKRGGRSRLGRMDLLQQMVRELDLSEEQKTGVAETIKKHNDLKNAWDKENGAKLKELSTQQRQARKDKDKEQLAEISKQLKPLDEARRKLDTDKMAAVMALLTKEQKAKWETYQFYTKIYRPYRQLRLNEEQQKQVRELCDKACKDIAALDPKAKDKKKAESKITNDLQAKIKETVLTDEQRERIRQREERAKGSRADADKTRKEGRTRKGKGE